MIRFSKIGSLLLACSLCINILAQSNGSSSSYSRFGLGTLENQAQGFNKAMGGVGIGYRAGNRANVLNPASYSAIDSITLILDAGMTAAFGNLKQNNNSINIYQCKLDYVNIGLRLYRNLGLAAGFMPYSTIGYDFSTSNRVSVNNNTWQTTTTTCNYNGDGGLHQVYLGLGYKVFKELSVGANASFIWGDYQHYILQSYYEGGVLKSEYNGLNSIQSANIRTWKLDLGIQYPIRLTKTDILTLGATASIGHKIKSNAMLSRFTDNQEDAPTDTAFNAFDLPYTYGIGAIWKHNENLIVGLDFQQEFWSSCRMPEMVAVGSDIQYIPKTGAYKNRTKFAVGAQYTPDAQDRHHYWKRIRYRLGANYSTPYLVVNGYNGPKDFSLTAGFGLPLSMTGDRSMVNIGLEWLRRAPSSSNLIKENYIMLNLGVTFNEVWFMKYKIQ